MPGEHQINEEDIYRLFGITDEERETFLGSPSNESYMRAREEAKAAMAALQARVEKHLQTIGEDLNGQLRAAGLPESISVEICPVLHADEKG